MLYAISDASQPVIFSAAGNLTNENQFVHPKRIMDSYELISVIKGTLHIQSGTRSYSLSPGQFVILFPGECHLGTHPSDGELSFYWTHFYFQTQGSTIFTQPQAAPFFQESGQAFYILPETGTLLAGSRVNVLFSQLLDLSRRLSSLSFKQCCYAQSALLLELTNECFFHNHLLRHGTKLPLAISVVMEWLQLNYDTALSVAGIAHKFGYHPSYLASLFKHYSGYTITEYRNRQRIHVAKNFLTSTPKLTVAEISRHVGIEDVKYFMRLFKRYEGITATAYRKAFAQKNKNRI